jgi:hypothetical protein
MATTRTMRYSSGLHQPAHSHWRRVATVVTMIAANIGAFMVLFQLYKLARRSFIVRGETVGFDHAVQVIHFEQRLHLFFEPRLQDFMLRHEWLIRGLNCYYVAFMWSFYACCVVAIALAPERFRHYRRVFFSSMVLALPWYALYPLAPPRMMSTFRLHDTLAIFGPNYFSNSGLVTANQFAAMPSMHIGWTTIGAFMLAAAIPYKRIGAILGVTHLSLMTLTVMATGNHYLVDVIGGWLIIGAAFAVANLLPDPLPLPWRARHEQTPPMEPARLRTQTAGGSARR